MDAQIVQTETILARGLSYADYERQFMGDARQTEWVNGDVILIMNNIPHNQILAWLTTVLTLYLGFKPVGKLLLAGVSIYISDQQPAREPDLMIVLNENTDRIKEIRLEGAADIAIEIVSPESRSRDYVTKYDEYAACGVREYWLLDPERRTADIYAQNGEGHYRRLATDSQGHIASALLRDFTLEPEVLWSENPPQGEALITLVKSMIIA